jgi:hypothetical protein
MYMLEYVVKKPQEEQRHLLSVVAMGFNGAAFPPSHSLSASLSPCSTWTMEEPPVFSVSERAITLPVVSVCRSLCKPFFREQKV